MSAAVDGGVVLCGRCGNFNPVGVACACLSENYDDECPGKSQSKCEYCGNCHSIFAVCNMNPNYQNGFTEVNTVEPCELGKLYNELGTMKWLGSDVWNEAVEAVRKEIANRINK